MKRKSILALFATVSTLIGCNDATAPEEKQMNSFIADLMSKMTLNEKIGQTVLFSSWWDVTGPISENDNIDKIKEGRVGGVFNALTCDFLRRMQQEAVEGTRLGIPLLFGYDVIHGYRTTFPTPLAISSSWDMEMVELMARSMAREAAADGLHWTFAPMVDISRDPRWGRVAEGAGEDPFLGSAIARAQVRGIQGDDLRSPETLLACVKHFAAYGAPAAGRDYNSVDMSERHLREFYLPPYKAALDEGCQTIMASFNDINGVPATSNRWLLTDLLRKEWGFDGMVVSDYTGVLELVNHRTAIDPADAGAQALRAGLDMDMQSGIFMNYTRANYEAGKVSRQEIDDACRRVLEMKYKLGLFEDPYRYCDSVRATETLKSPALFHAAHEAAKRSIVLLKNEDALLPLRPETTRSIALIGPMARNRRNQLGAWHTGGREETVTPIDVAFAAKYPATRLFVADGCGYEGNDRSGFAEAITAARQAEVVVLCLGEQEFESGEAASKTDLRLAAVQRALIDEIARLKKPMVLLLHNGRPMLLAEEEGHFDAILEVWHLGSMAGSAIADVVAGDHNPSGKLTMTFPRNMGQIPIHYNSLPTGRPETHERFTSRYLDSPNSPLYPFGYGLSYTTFSYSPITLDRPTMTRQTSIRASVTVSNTGTMDGEEVVQLYINDPVASVSRPVRELKGFRKVAIPAGDSVTVEFEITDELLRFHNPELVYGSEPGDFTLWIGGNSQTENKQTFTLE